MNIDCIRGKERSVTVPDVFVSFCRAFEINLT